MDKVGQSKIEKYLYDGGGWLSQCKSASLREDNKDVEPTYIKWLRGDAHHDISTDGWIKKVVEYWRDNEVSRDLICWLIEPRGLRPENYEIVDKNADLFSTILTYDKELLEKYPDKCRFYPLGGSSIAFYKWGLYPKTKDVAMILSDKKTTEGHKLRHQIAEEFGDRIDLYGAGVGKPFDSKFEVLKDYRYAIVVESCNVDTYFSEKLIDPISVGTIPIYCGCPSINDYFITQFGIRRFEGLKYLERILSWIILKYTSQSYYETHEGRFGNFERAKKYRIAEDQIFERHGDLFS